MDKVGSARRRLSGVITQVARKAHALVGDVKI